MTAYPIPTHLKPFLTPLGEKNSELSVTGVIRCNAGDALLAQRACALEAAIAADDDQAGHIHIAQQLGRASLHSLILELHAPGGTQLRAGQVGDIQRLFQIQFHKIGLGVFAQQAVKAAIYAQQGHVEQRRAAGDSGNRRVHARAVAAAGQYSNVRHKKFILLSNAAAPRKTALVSRIGTIPL